MEIRRCHRVLLAVSIGIIWTTSALAQDQPAAQDSSAKPLSPKEARRRAKQFYKELGPPDKEWLENVVPDIITPDERKAFLELSTNEEREQFIEIFWDKRNPDPESPINTAKEEHYRRLAYADEHFSSGLPGKKPARGRIYINRGRPDELESHRMGGAYQRSSEQGGGE